MTGIDVSAPGNSNFALTSETEYAPYVRRAIPVVKQNSTSDDDFLTLLETLGIDPEKQDLTFLPRGDFVAERVPQGSTS